MAKPDEYSEIVPGILKRVYRVLHILRKMVPVLPYSFLLPILSIARKPGWTSISRTSKPDLELKNYNINQV
jgi:hypothetical protein